MNLKNLDMVTFSVAIYCSIFTLTGDDVLPGQDRSILYVYFICS